MSKLAPLGLTGALSMTAGGGSVWIADTASKSAVRYDPASARVAGKIGLESAPLDITWAGGILAFALEGGGVAAHDAASGRPLWRAATAAAGSLRLSSGPDCIWAWEPGGVKAWAFDLGGGVVRYTLWPIASLAAVSSAAYILGADGRLGYQEAGQPLSDAEPLKARSSSWGAMAACANALWVSAANSLILVDRRTLAIRATLAAPEGPVPHLVCDDGRLMGGLHSAFLFDPAADGKVRPLDVHSRSSWRAIAATSSCLWLLETGEASVQILEVP